MPAPINITFDIAQALKRAGVIIKEAPDQIKRSVSLAIDRSLETFRTTSVRETAHKYFVQQKYVRAHLTLKKSYGGNMNGAVIASSYRRLLSHYKITPSKPPVKEGTFRGAVKRAGGLKPIPPAFLMPAKTKNGEMLPTIRDKFGDYERLRTLRSPSVTQLVKNKETVAEAEQKARETFEKRLIHELEHSGEW